MIWLICFVIAAVVLAVFVLAAVIRSKTTFRRGGLLDPIKLVTLGAVLSIVALSVPVFLHAYADSTNTGGLEKILLSIHHAVRLFVVDGDFGFVMDHVIGEPGWLASAYSVLFAILFILAPVLTFGVVLSFFKNVSAYNRYILRFFRDGYIFSQLNEQSLALAASVIHKDPKSRFVVFTNVQSSEDQHRDELRERADELGAICFSTEMAAGNFIFHSKRANLYFFAMDLDHTENVNQALKLIPRIARREKTHLYVFSTQMEAELILAGAFPEEEEDQKLHIRYINEVESLIQRTLYDSGHKLFENAVRTEQEKQINAVIVGMGRHGIAMTKALTWLCQMDGYALRLHGYDQRKNAESSFASMCPELMKKGYNHVFDVDGEARYSITIHGDIDVTAREFDEALLALPQVTYVLVTLGTDEMNVAVAAKLRSLFERAGHHPQIQAIVYDSDKRASLEGITNFKGQSYDIEFIGDVERACSEEVILHSDIENEALSRHTKWGSELSFWKYSYNYNSSIASVIHRKMKIFCGIPGAEKPKEQRTEEELWTMRKLEHCRWNAYMRAQGYSYAEKRNDLAKTHHCLVPFKDLPLSEQIKDDD